MTEIRPEAVVIGTSAGALDALTAILPQLPKGFRLPVMVVVHLPPDKDSIIADLFEGKCKIPVLEAEDKEPIKQGAIYFAPPDYHLLVESGGYLSLSNEEPVLFSRPSIDVLFETAADAYGAGLIGVVLTGANNDGAQGSRAIRDAGGQVVVQRPDLAYAPAMPEAALRACPDARALALPDIVGFLKEAALT